uniref:Uncharacterized protein n=1 Tax=Naja naja TaxID=35670 RepID=A0A8C6XJR5_NAJNA
WLEDSSSRGKTSCPRETGPLAFRVRLGDNRLPKILQWGQPSTPLTPTQDPSLLSRLPAGEDAGLAPRREVAIDFEGVAGTALVGIDPVFAWGEGRAKVPHRASSWWGVSHDSNGSFANSSPTHPKKTRCSSLGKVIWSVNIPPGFHIWLPKQVGCKYFFTTVLCMWLGGHGHVTEWVASFFFAAPPACALFFCLLGEAVRQRGESWHS